MRSVPVVAMSRRQTFLALLAAGLVSSALPAAQQDRVSDYIRAQLQWRMIPGVALGVMENGRLIRAEGYGVTDLDHRDSVRASTLFHLGSVGKQFTSAAVLLLAQDGRLRLDDDVTVRLRSAPPSWRGVTLRHLLTHTSGLGDYDDAIADLSREYPKEELIRLIAAERPLIAPGTRFRYSNSGYALLGMVVEEASGEPLAGFLSRRIFEPLGMRSTGVAGSAGWPRPNAAQGYRRAAGSLVVAPAVSRSLNSTGDGSVYSSVGDLERWDAALYADALLTDASRSAMWAPARLNSGKSSSYGFGWSLGSHRGRRFVAHGGNWQGFSSAIVRYLDDRITVVVLTNLTGIGDAPSRMAHRVARFHISALRPESWPAVTRVLIDSATLDRYAGEFRLGDVAIRVWRENDGLMLTSSGRGSARLLPLSMTRFVIDADDLQIRFAPAGARRPDMYVREGDAERRAIRVRPPAP